MLDFSQTFSLVFQSSVKTKKITSGKLNNLIWKLWPASDIFSLKQQKQQTFWKPFENRNFELLEGCQDDRLAELCSAASAGVEFITRVTENESDINQTTFQSDPISILAKHSFIEERWRIF